MTIYQIIIFHKTPRTILHKTPHMAPLASLHRKPYKALHRKKATSKHKKKNNLQAKIDGGIFNIIQRKDTEKLKEPSAAATSYNVYTPAAASYDVHTSTTSANMETLSPTETEPSLLRKSSGNEYHDHYRLISPTELYSSSDEETSPNHASPTMDHQDQITYPQIDIIGPDLIQEDYEELIKLIATAKDMNVLPDILLSERTTKCTSERKVALFELLECLQINGQKF